MDSTPLFDAVATQDTVTQLRAAIRKLLQVLPADVRAEVRGVLARDDEYATLGKPPCDWDDPAAREALVDALVIGALAAVAAVDGTELPPAALQAAELLALVAGQDVACGDDGVFRIIRGVARDRTISVVDTQARHGHKSRHRRFDGYKTHLAISPEDEIITGAAATPANIPDREVAADLVDDLADEHDHDDNDHRGDGDHGNHHHDASDHDDHNDGGGGGDSFGGEADSGRPTLVGDSAYADAATRNTLAQRGIDTMAKVPPARNSRGGYTKDDFAIDTDAATVTCPAGNTVTIRESARGGGRAAFGAVCRTCALSAPQQPAGG